MEYIREESRNYFCLNPIKIIDKQSIIRDRRKPEAKVFFCYALDTSVKMRVYPSYWNRGSLNFYW